MTVAVENQTRPLLKTDLCDKCRVPATKVARNKKNKELLFCDHHANENNTALVYQGFYMDVETLEARVDPILKTLATVQ